MIKMVTRGGYLADEEEVGMSLFTVYIIISS